MGDEDSVAEQIARGNVPNDDSFEIWKLTGTVHVAVSALPGWQSIPTER
jgi:hypothetical protein